MINADVILNQISSAKPDGIDKAALLKEYPDPVARFFRYHLPHGFPEHTYSEVPMKGIIKLVNWANFRSTLFSQPFKGFLWQANVKMGILPVAGYDYFLKNQGAMKWTTFGVIPVMKADGPDVSRSAEGRARMEALFAPHLLIHPDISWEVISENEITATWKIHQEEQPLHLIIGIDGSLKETYIQRWGNPGGVKEFGYHTFGVKIEAEMKYKGTVIPAKGNAGWWFGSDRYKDGEFFRFEVG